MGAKNQISEAGTSVVGRILTLPLPVGMARCAVLVAERQRQATERITASVRFTTFVPPAGAGGDGAARHPYPTGPPQSNRSPQALSKQIEASRSWQQILMNALRVVLRLET